MPYLKLIHQDIPVFINVAHIVGMQAHIGMQDTQNGMETKVKLLASRSELDQTFLFDSEEEAIIFMHEIADYSLNPEAATFETAAEIVTDDE